MGRDETLAIPWHEIERIGLDAILVRTELPVPEEQRQNAGFLAKLRRWLKGERFSLSSGHRGWILPKIAL